MLSINTNLASLIAQRSMKESTNKLDQSIERMTTGAKINHAKDNAANYSIATNMTTKLGALQVAEDNCAMGLDMLATANGTLDQIHDKLQRLRDLIIQTRNGTYGAQSLEAIAIESNALVDEIERIYNTTNYNNINIFDAQAPLAETVAAPTLNEDGFIQAITKRNTSSMTALSTVNTTVALADGTYSISTAEELKILSDMTNAGLISAGDEFVLANDIDLSQYENWTPIGDCDYDSVNGNATGISFKGKFDGNGYVISNLKIQSTSHYAGLFGYAAAASIKNVGVENACIEGVDSKYIGIIVGYANQASQIVNCHTSGRVLSSEFAVGGIVGEGYNIESCYSYASVYAGDCAGGLMGACWSSIKNSFFDGQVAALATNCSGGLAGKTHRNDVIIENCHANLHNEYQGGVFVGYVNPTTKSITLNNCSYTSKEEFKLVGSNKSGITVNTNNISKNLKENIVKSLQIGTSGSETSQLTLDMGFDIAEVNILRITKSLNFSSYYLKNLDRILTKVSNKQVELGATENRLNSALEEISTQYENLLSSRSTIQDADMAEVSSEYIRQQILQQASATLMSTANQSASIALSLI